MLPSAEVITIWLGAGLTLAIYSFLYKDNPAYKLAEHIYVGVSTGYVICIQVDKVLRLELYEPLVRAQRPEDFIVIIPGIMGLMMFTRFFRKFAWVSRITLSFIIGATAGIAAPNQIQGFLIKHSQATIVPLISSPVSIHAIQWGEIAIFIGVISVLIYFFFSVEHKGLLKPISRVGIIYLMIFFGAAFGYMMMGRISLLIGRMRFLVLEWLRTIF